MVNFDISFIQNQEESGKHSSMQNELRNSSGCVQTSSRSLKAKALKSNGSLKIDMTHVEGVMDHTEQIEKFKKEALEKKDSELKLDESIITESDIYES